LRWQTSAFLHRGGQVHDQQQTLDAEGQRGAFVALTDDVVQVRGALRGGRLQAEVIQEEQISGRDVGQQARVGATGAGRM
jgi:hypothetical protein